MKVLQTQHFALSLPAFFPDATFGFVRGVETKDLFNTGTSGAVVNAYHLFRLGKGELIASLGGIHKFMGLEGKTIITDSGGWQVMSLIHDSAKQSSYNSTKNSISEEAITFFDPETKEKIVFTPELSIQIQLQLDPDIMICLDNCTRPDAPLIEQEKSVEQTILWAARCKKEFDRFLAANSPIVIPAKAGIQSASAKTSNTVDSGFRQNDNTSVTKNIIRPLLFAVIQGGYSKKLRKKCATELLKIGFDGFSFGGHPVGENGKLVTEILEYTANLIPDSYQKYAMGIGRPEDIVKCFKMGYTMFDCVIPTREARHKKLYISTPLSFPRKRESTFFYDVLYINTALAEDTRPIDPTCDCQACRNYTRAYILHLFQMKDPMGARLATIHNLRFYAKLMEKLSHP